VFKRYFLALVLIVLTVNVTGCGQGNFLSDVSIRPGIISPNADGIDDIAELKYTLKRQSSVTIYLLDASGQRHTLRADKRRSPSPRTTYVSGVVDGSLLPDGMYTVTIVAVDEGGREQQQQVPLTLKGGDPVPLEIQSLSIFPKEFTPNRDGITDRVKISYNLNKLANRVDVYVIDAKGNKYPVTEDKIREMGAPGPHEHDYDAGIDYGATPPPDGDYTVVVEAEDAVGNLAKVEGKITIKDGGVPRVEIVNGAAVFAPLVVPLGGMLSFTCTIKNVGTVPIRTKGPESGTTYTTTENFNTLGQYEEPGIFRVGLDFEGNSAGRLYPFRWQLGKDSELTVLETDIGPQKYLMPGQSVTLTGHLVIADRPPKVQPYYWIGLIEEQVQMIQDRVQATPISIGY
jgi:hypothetical protein